MMNVSNNNKTTIIWWRKFHRFFFLSFSFSFLLNSSSKYYLFFARKFNFFALSYYFLLFVYLVSSKTKMTNHFCPDDKYLMKKNQQSFVSDALQYVLGLSFFVVALFKLKSLNFFSIGIIESSECVEPIICCSFVLNMNTISCDCILMFFHLTGMSVKYVTTVEYWTSVVADSKLSYTANSKAHAGKLKAFDPFTAVTDIVHGNTSMQSHRTQLFGLNFF